MKVKMRKKAKKKNKRRKNKRRKEHMLLLLAQKARQPSAIKAYEEILFLSFLMRTYVCCLVTVSVCVCLLL